MNILGIDVFEIAVTLLAVLTSIVLHEVAHGYVAYLCGDPTAKEAGRLTLNPVRHLDLFGSIILPALLFAIHAPVFAYAKPVPYDPRRLRHRRRDELLVALSGPGSNLLQAVIGTGIWALLVIWAPQAVLASPYLQDLLLTYVYVNLMLMFFNLIPLPPLDGSSIIGWFLKGRALVRYYQLQRYALPILILAFFIVPEVLGWDPLAWYINHTALPLYDWLCFSWL